MDANRLACIIILLVFAIMGCSGNYGSVSKQTGAVDKVSLAELRENWNDYDIYYDTRNGRWAAAILFDPKNNETKLTGESWIKIEDQEALSKSIREVQLWYDFARVHIIEGPDNQVFGYLYYPTYLQVSVKAVDEQTLYVSRLPRFRSAP